MSHVPAQPRAIGAVVLLLLSLALGLLAASPAAAGDAQPNPHATDHPNENAFGKSVAPAAPAAPAPAPASGGTVDLTPSPIPSPTVTPGALGELSTLALVTDRPLGRRAAHMAPSAPPVVEPSRDEPGTPSTLGSHVVTLADLVRHPEVPATAGFLGVALVMLVFVTTEFLGEALAHQYSLFAGFLRRQRKLAHWSDRVADWIVAHRGVSAVALVAATSSVFTLVDPSLGLDLVSLRMWLSCAVAIIVINYLSILATDYVSGRLWNVHTVVRVMPWGLAVAVVAVGLSRVLNISPGFLVGAILGISALGEPGGRLVSRVVQTRTAVVLVIAVGAWLLVGAMPALDPRDSRAFWSQLTTESLVAISAAGLTAILVSLLPFSLLEGGELYRYSRREWAVTFGVTALAFCVIEVPAAANLLAVDNSLGTWIIVAACILVIAGAVYLLSLRVTGRHRAIPDREHVLAG